MAHARDDGGGGGGLAGLHAGARQRDNRHAAHLERGLIVERLVAHARGDADPFPQIGKAQHRAEHLTVERFALVLSRRVANPEDAADVEHLHHVAGLQRLGDVARIAEQGFAVTQCADHDVTARYLGHPAAGELQRVVVGLAVLNLDHQHHPFLAGDLG